MKNITTIIASILLSCSALKGMQQPTLPSRIVFLQEIPHLDNQQCEVLHSIPLTDSKHWYVSTDSTTEGPTVGLKAVDFKGFPFYRFFKDNIDECSKQEIIQQYLKSRRYPERHPYHFVVGSVSTLFIGACAFGAYIFYH